MQAMSAGKFKLARGRVVICALCLVCVSGCAAPRPPTRPLLPTTTLFVELLPRPSLPPTWTPAPTETPIPSVTPLPTETPVPTLSAEALCKTFGLISAPTSGGQFEYDGKVTFGWTNLPPDVRLSLTITLRGGKQGIRLDVDAPGDNLVPIPLTRLPDESSGTYDWKVWLQSPQYGEVCIQTGYFIRKELKIF